MLQTNKSIGRVQQVALRVMPTCDIITTLGLSNLSNPRCKQSKVYQKKQKKRIILIRIILLILIMMRKNEDDDGGVRVQVVYKQSIVGTVVAWGRAPLVEEAEAAEPVGVAGS